LPTRYGGNARIRRIVIPLVKILTGNMVYSIQFGNRKIKRKGGVEFLRLSHRNMLEEQFLSSLDLKGKTVYDIGAFAGILTAFFSQNVGDAGKVVAFEPNPDNYLEVKKTVKLNDLKNVIILNIGVADTAGNATMAVRYNAGATSSMDPSIKKDILSEKFTGVLQIAVDTVDHCLIANDLPSPDFIKMDIEGMEYPALKGLDKTIKKYSPEMYIEIHGVDRESKIANITRIMELLKSYGYDVFHVEKQSSVTLENVEIAKEGHIFCKKRIEK
jgi:FkbM family methyltransferase